MKASSFFCLFAAAVLGGALPTPLFATREKPTAFAHAIAKVETRDGSRLECGASPAQVIDALGQPARQLDADLWIYPGYDGGSAQAAKDDCELLLVIFRGGKVVELKLINPAAENVYAKWVTQETQRRTQLASQAAVERRR